MTEFKKDLVVKLLSDGKHWEVVEGFSFYTTQINGAKVFINIPSGWETDFASIPKIFCLFITYKDKYNKAAVLHDYLYSLKKYRRDIADKLFLEGMKVLGINKFKAYIFYISVRLFGWISWYKKRG